MIKLTNINYQPIIRRLNQIQFNRGWGGGCNFNIFDSEAQNYLIHMEIDHTIFKLYHNKWLDLVIEGDTEVFGLNFLDNYVLEIIKTYLPELSGNNIIIEHRLTNNDTYFMFRQPKSNDVYNFVGNLISHGEIYYKHNQNLQEYINHFSDDFFCRQYLKVI